MVKDKRINDEYDRYVSYVVDSEDWEGLEGMAWDDVSGKILDQDMVKAARKEEIEEYHKHEVYTKTEIGECWKETGKAPIKVKWIDINKGGAENPEYRSRLVAKEIKRDMRDE